MICLNKAGSYLNRESILWTFLQNLWYKNIILFKTLYFDRPPEPSYLKEICIIQTKCVSYDYFPFLPKLHNLFRRNLKPRVTFYYPGKLPRSVRSENSYCGACWDNALTQSLLHNTQPQHLHNTSTLNSPPRDEWALVHARVLRVPTQSRQAKSMESFFVT